MIEERNLRRVASGAYMLTLPDAREILVGRVYHETLSVRGSTISARVVPRWRWEVHNHKTQQVSGQQGFTTRRDAFAEAVKFVRRVPVDSVLDETE